MKKYILIWWPPTTGKSTLAQNLSREIGLPWFSTDQIRMLMKIYALRDETGWLFLPEWHDTVDTFLGYYSPEEIVEMEFAQAHDVWPGIQTMIDDCYSYPDGCIIEWVNITPKLAAKHLSWRDDVLTLFVTDNNEQRIRDVIYTRWLFADAKKYSDTYKEKEVEWVQLYIEQLREQCEKYDFPCISVNKQNNDVEKILPLVAEYFKE